MARPFYEEQHKLQDAETWLEDRARVWRVWDSLQTCEDEPEYCSKGHRVDPWNPWCFRCEREDLR